ncbi:MAG: DUF3179 domain-containing (seleno)protein [Isosphaeraceae bacterium]
MILPDTSRTIARILGLAALALAAIVGAVFVSEGARLAGRAGSWRTQAGEPPEHQALDFEADGIRLPESYPAGSAAIGDDEEVIGVIAGDEARAYRLAGLADRRRHILNDRVGDVPVSVTYCDLSDCARAFRGPDGGEPLPIGLAGMFDGRMILRVDGFDFFQDTTLPRDPAGRPFPFQAAPFERTTWKAWRQAHPHTTIAAIPPPPPAREGPP